MCGIAGIIDHKGTFDRSRCEKMSYALIDRGPDQSGMYFEGPASLIHRRLAIIDIENSRQPMSAVWGDENYTIVYNGELYNTYEIKNELIKLGHAFRTEGDTEVVLHAYIEWGEKCLDKFNGIFAFAVCRAHRLARIFDIYDRKSAVDKRCRAFKIHAALIRSARDECIGHFFAARSVKAAFVIYNAGNSTHNDLPFKIRRVGCLACYHFIICGI